jgi:hypothetical protein
MPLLESDIQFLHEHLSSCRNRRGPLGSGSPLRHDAAIWSAGRSADDRAEQLGGDGIL